MNPNTSTFTDANTRQYLAYDSWLYQERIRNWSAYTTYCQYKQQQQVTHLRIQQLQIQVQQQQQQLLLQEQFRQQQQKLAEQANAEADFQSYIKEIDELREEDSTHLEPSEPSVPSADCWDVSEKFQPTQEKKWRKEYRRDRRHDSKHVLEYYKQVREGIPPAPEVLRAEHFNANKPPRILRYESAQKRKTKKRNNQRTYGSGWGKQLE
jgi:hypothetical protein